jgi:hypothetical protein
VENNNGPVRFVKFIDIDVYKVTGRYFVMIKEIKEKR